MRSPMLAALTPLIAALGWRSDSGETASFLRQLEYIKAQTFDVRYPALKARALLPVDSSVPSGAESFTWRSWDMAGMAKILSNYADDLPAVDAIAAEVTQAIKSIGDSYGYTIQDIRAAAFAGSQLDVKRALAARRAVENKIEALAALGDSAAGLPGALNNPNVPLLTALGGDITGGWTSATSQQIVDDLNKIANTVFVTTKGTHTPDTMVLPISRYSLLSSKPWSQYDSTPVLQVFLRNSPYIRNIDQWAFLDTADAAGTGPRALCYERSPEVLGLVIPQEFEQFPPQPNNLAFKVPCHARIGGVSVHYPLAMLYVDGI